MSKIFKGGISVMVAVLLAASPLVLGCASMGVSMQGANYFVGKSESQLTKYFGYAGEEVHDGEGEYDKILYFTNKVVSFTASKQNVVRYKVSTSERISVLTFTEHNDGCLVLSNYRHFTSAIFGIASGGVSRILSPARHENNNAVVRAEISKFNNELKRLQAVPIEEKTAQFNKTNIGNWYFVYQTTQKYASTHYQDNNKQMITDQYVIYSYILDKVDVKADDRIETESYTAFTYNEYRDSFYDGNGNTISEERGNTICADYEKKGFDIKKMKMEFLCWLI